LSADYYRYLGVDLGQKRTGLAHTDLLRTIASPLETVLTSELMTRLHELINTGQYKGLVVGWPLETSGKEGKSVERVRSFINQVEKQFSGLEIHKVDERYSSEEASSIMVLSGMPKKKRQEKKRVDQIAAAIILQRFLDYNSH
jgi:putative holliday junction resolvase